MTIEEAITSRLKTQGDLVALVGARIYLLMVPQAPTYPFVRVQGVSDVWTAQLRGPVGLKAARVQIDACARVGSGLDPYAITSSVLDAVIGDGAGPLASGLNGWIGQVGSPGVAIMACLAAGRTPGRFNPDELQVVTQSQDFDVWYQAA